MTAVNVTDDVRLLANSFVTRTLAVSVDWLVKSALARWILIAVVLTVAFALWLLVTPTNLSIEADKLALVKALRSAPSIWLIVADKLNADVNALANSLVNSKLID